MIRPEEIAAFEKRLVGELAVRWVRENCPGALSDEQAREWQHWGGYRDAYKAGAQAVQRVHYLRGSIEAYSEIALWAMKNGHRSAQEEASLAMNQSEQELSELLGAGK